MRDVAPMTLAWVMLRTVWSALIRLQVRLVATYLQAPSFQLNYASRYKSQVAILPAHNEQEARWARPLGGWAVRAHTNISRTTCKIKAVIWCSKGRHGSSYNIPGRSPLPQRQRAAVTLHKPLQFGRNLRVIWSRRKRTSRTLNV